MANDGARVSAYEVVQIAREAVPGVASNAFRRLVSTDIRIKPTINKKSIKPMGSKLAVATITGRDHTEGDISGDQNFAEMVYYFAGCYGVPVVTTPSGATLTRRRLYRLHGTQPDPADVFTVQRGSYSRGGKQCEYGFIPDLTLSFKESDATIAGKLYGRGMTKGIVMGDTTADSAAFPIVEVPPCGVDLYFGTDLANLALLQGCTALDVAVTGRQAAQYVIAKNKCSFRAPLEKSPEVKVNLTLDDDSLSIGYLQGLKSNTTYFLRINAVSPQLIEAGFPYKYEMIVALQFMSTEDDTQDEYEVAKFEGVGVASSLLGGSALTVLLDSAIDTAVIGTVATGGNTGGNTGRHDDLIYEQFYEQLMS